MAEALRVELQEEAFTVDLTKISRLAANRACDYTGIKTGAGKDKFAGIEGACEYFTYGWLKAISEELAKLKWPVKSAHLLPSTEDGDCRVADVVLVVENGTAALDLVCASLEVQYEQAARQQGLDGLIKVHVLPAGDAERGHALCGGIHNPALQIWP